MQKDPTQRFSDRVDNYVKYRPSYPKDLVDEVIKVLHINEASVVADIGSGTGIFTELLLNRGLKVIGVEPNKEMRAVAEQAFKDRNNFTSVPGKAEETTLEASSVDAIVCAQAFHWFDREKTKKEWTRILKKSSTPNVAIVWNERSGETSPFLAEYENILKMCNTEYDKVNHKLAMTDEVNAAFFGEWKVWKTRHAQYFDLEGLKGRLQSSSYCPSPDSSEFKIIMDKLTQLFEKYNVDGKVQFDYVASIYYGKL